MNCYKSRDRERMMEMQRRVLQCLLAVLLLLTCMSVCTEAFHRVAPSTQLNAHRGLSHSLATKGLGLKKKEVGSKLLLPSTSVPVSASRLHAMLPGEPIVTGTLTQGIINAIGLFNNVLLLR